MTDRLKGNVTTIGLFDSGVGGLSVLRQLQRFSSAAVPAHKLRFLYVGDTARCPYGNREPQEIRLYVSQIVDWLLGQGVSSIVMACNTSAALASSVARLRSSVPVFDLIGPTAQFLAQSARKVAVLATASTVRSQAFSRAIALVNRSIQVLEIACPELVPLVERGEILAAGTRDILWKYVRQVASEKVDAVVLGCTHYPFLIDLLRGMLAPPVLLVDPAERLLVSLADQVQLPLHCQPGDASDRPWEQTDLFVTGSPSHFLDTAQICLGRRPGTVYGIGVQELELALGSRLPAEILPGAEHPASPVVSGSITA